MVSTKGTVREACGVPSMCGLLMSMAHAHQQTAHQPCVLCPLRCGVPCCT